jgi:gas vesicle protein
MSKKTSFGLGTLVAATAGAIAGALGAFLSDKDNRQKVMTEAKKVEKVVEADLRKAKKVAKKVTTKAKAVAKKARKTTKRRR